MDYFVGNFKTEDELTGFLNKLNEKGFNWCDDSPIGTEKDLDGIYEICIELENAFIFVNFDNKIISVGEKRHKLITDVEISMNSMLEKISLI